MPRYRKKGIYRKRRKVRTKKPASKRRRLGTGADVLQSAANVAQTLMPVAAEAYNQYRRFKNRGKTQSQTQTRMRSKFSEGTGAYNQWSERYQKAKLGTMTLRKMLGVVQEPLIQTWQQITRFGNGGGLFLKNAENAAASPTYRDLPVYAVDLTSTRNWVNGAATDANPVFSLQKKHGAAGVGGFYKWVQVAGVDYTGATAATWQTEYSPHRTNTQLAYPNDNSVLKWVSIQMVLYGMKNYPTKYTIEVCQFHEDFVPIIQQDTDITDGTYGEYWDNMTKRYTFSPLAQLVKGTASSHKNMKVIRRYNVLIDPTANFENDPTPHCKTFKIFLEMNRRCSYDWKLANTQPQTMDTIASNQDYDTQDYKQEDNENQTTVDPKARIFLLIRASNYNIQNDPATVSTTNSPSFDMKIRTKHLINS